MPEGKEEEEPLDLPMDLFQAPTRLPMNSPIPSIGLRKSINWACPVATSMQKTYVKRSSTRLSGKSVASTNPWSTGSIESDKHFKETVQSSEEERPIRVVSFGNKRRERKHKAVSLAASPTEPQQEESKYCSIIQKASHSQTHKRARIVQSGESDQLDHGTNPDVVQAEKAWISVPLDSMAGADKDDYQAQDSIYSEAKESSSRSPDDEATKTIEVHRSKVALCFFNTAWEELNPELSMKISAAEKHDITYKKLCESLAVSKKKVHDTEHMIQELLEDQLKALRKENTRIADMAALEQERLHNENSRLSQTNSRILKENLAFERDKVDMRNDFLQTVERTRESLRLELGRKHLEIVAGLNKELDQEREKSICQICFLEPRDAIILPCMHFEYCSDCLRELKGCPSCRAKINGVLHCNLCKG